MYKELALAFAVLPTGHQMRLEDRVSFAYLDRCVIFQNRTGVWAVQEDEDGEKIKMRIQIPVGTLAVLALGHGTSITHAAMISTTRSGATVVFSGNGGSSSFAAATPLSSSARWAIAQARLISSEDHARDASIILYRQQLGLEMIPGGNIKSMRGMEGRTIRDLYAKMARKYKTGKFKRDTAGDDPVNQCLNLGNAILYGCAAAACSAIGANPALGIIHRGDSRSLLFDLADLYKPSITIPLAFEAASQPDPHKFMREAVRKQLHSKRVMVGMLKSLMQVLEPHLPNAVGDRLVDDAGEVPGHTSYSAAEPAQ